MNRNRDFVDAFHHVCDSVPIPMTYGQAIEALRTTQWWAKLTDKERRYLSFRLRLEMDRRAFQNRF